MATGGALGRLNVVLGLNSAEFTRGLTRAEYQAKRSLDSIAASARNVERAFIGFAGLVGASSSIRQIAQYADAFTGLQNRLRLVTDSETELASATTDLFDISLRTAQSVDSTSQVYQRFAQNADRLGLSLKDIGVITDTVTKAVAISGASASSAEAALVQFGQAIASGVLRGQELNSVMEQTPGLAMAIADGLQVPVGALRGLAAEGKITSDELIKALRNAAIGVNEAFGTRTLTVGQGFENLNTAVTEYVGRVDTAIGVSSGLANAMDSLAGAISAASRDLDDLGRDIDAVKELFSILDDVGQDFMQNFMGNTGDITQYFYTSFADSFLATARELDRLWDAFDGAARALEALFDTAANNIRVAFENVFNAVREMVSEWVHNISTTLNTLPGVDLDTSMWVGPGAESFKSLSDAAKEAYAQGGKTVDLYQDLLDRLNARGQTTASDLGSTTTGIAARASSGASGGPKKKGRTKDADPLGVFIKDMNIDYAMDEYQKYLDFVDEITGRTSRRQIEQQREWLSDALRLGNITYTEYEKAMDKLAKKGEDTMSQIDEFTLQAARNIQDSLGDGLYSLLSGNFDDIGSRFGDMVMRMAADAAAANIAGALFGDYGKTGNIGGIIGSIGASLFGPASAPAGVTPGVDWTFATGGYTGPGGKYEPAGIVHRGEYVLNQEATRRIGVSALERMNRGYASGGLVGGGSTGAAQPMKVEVNLTNTGGQQMAVQSATPHFDGEKLVLNVMLKDLRTNGPYARQLKGAIG